MANATSFFGSGGVKKVQRGVVNGSQTIDAVDLSKSVVIFSGDGGGMSDSGGGPFKYEFYGYLQDSTTVVTNVMMGWQVIEYY